MVMAEGAFPACLERAVEALGPGRGSGLRVKKQRAQGEGREGRAATAWHRKSLICPCPACATRAAVRGAGGSSPRGALGRPWGRAPPLREAPEPRWPAAAAAAAERGELPLSPAPAGVPGFAPALWAQTRPSAAREPQRGQLLPARPERARPCRCSPRPLPAAAGPSGAAGPAREAARSGRLGKALSANPTAASASGHRLLASSQLRAGPGRLPASGRAPARGSAAAAARPRSAPSTASARSSSSRAQAPGTLSLLCPEFQSRGAWRPEAFPGDSRVGP